MKKVLAILVLAGFLASCNSGDDKAKAAADSTRIADSTAAAQKTADSLKAAMDTTHKDTTMKPKM